MITISIRQFRANMSKYLKELPVTILRHGRPIAVISRASQDINKIDTPVDIEKHVEKVKTEVAEKIPEKNIIETKVEAEKVVEQLSAKQEDICEHGAMKGLCKEKDCKNYMFK